MKHLNILILTIICIYSLNAQEIEPKYYSFSTTRLEYRPIHTSILDTLNYSFKTNTESLLLYDLKFSNDEFYVKEINTRLFSNLKFTKNTFISPNSNLRCKPLDNGITNEINSRDVMLSNILDNFVNNILFKGKGVFFKN